MQERELLALRAQLARLQGINVKLVCSLLLLAQPDPWLQVSGNSSVLQIWIAKGSKLYPQHACHAAELFCAQLLGLLPSASALHR